MNMYSAEVAVRHHRHVGSLDAV